MSAAYLDSSFFLAGLFDERGEVKNLEVHGQIYSSRLLQTECLRVLIRRLLDKKISEENYAHLKSIVLKAVSGVNLIQIDESILSLAETPFPVGLATLDSIHLASVLRLKEHLDTTEVFFFTHDEKLGKAAKVMGFEVVGV